MNVVFFFVWTRLCSGLSLWCDCSPQQITSDRAPWCAASRKKTKQYATPLSSATLWSWINAVLPRAIFSLFLNRGHMCSNASSRPLIGSGWPEPPPVLVAPRQHISLPGAHVRRQMESESVSGLSEMSFTSAARKESGHSWSGITRWKGGVRESLSSTLTSLTPR